MPWATTKGCGARVVEAYKALERDCDFVVCEGTDFTGAAPALDFGLNADLANELGAPVLVVVKAGSPANTAASVRVARDSLHHKGCTVFGVLVNRVAADDMDEVRAMLASQDGAEPVYLIPEDAALACATVAETADALGATTLSGTPDALQREVRDVRVGAMSVEHFVENLVDGALVIVPGDRPDILVATLASTVSPTIPAVSGVVLTGGYELGENVRRLLESAPFAVLEVPQLTHEAAAAVQTVRPLLRAEDERRIARALGLFEANVDTGELERRMAVERPPRVTPIMFEYELIERARAAKSHIVLPEGDDDRILTAADILDPPRRRPPHRPRRPGPGAGAGRRARRRPRGRRDRRPAPLAGPRRVRSRLLRAAQAQGHDRGAGRGCHGRPELLRDDDGALGHGRRDGLGRGAHDGRHDPARLPDHRRARGRFRRLERLPHVPLRPRARLRRLRRQPEPGPGAARRHRHQLLGDGRRVRNRAEDRDALLLDGRVRKGADVDAVRQATEAVRERRPDLKVEGPIQYDAAVDASVAKLKLPDSDVAGNATVFVFPDLETGNVAYKAVQRSAHAVAIGPVLQGLRKPVNDLSRGCTVPDIVNTVAITAIQARGA